MDTESRLAKLEKAAGIGDPCPACGNWADDYQRQLLFLSEHCAQLHQPGVGDLKPGRCDGCGGPVLYDLTFLSPEDRRLWAELVAEGDAAEREVSQEWWRAVIGIYDREEAARRAHYGDIYDRSLEQSELPRFRRWMEEQMNSAA